MGQFLLMNIPRGFASSVMKVVNIRQVRRGSPDSTAQTRRGSPDPAAIQLLCSSMRRKIPPRRRIENQPLRFAADFVESHASQFLDWLDRRLGDA
jgi:hypothetical protein